MSTTEPVFTLEAVGWQPWLEVVDPAQATPEQAAVLEETPKSSQSSGYYRLLLHDPAALLERTRLFNAVMYSQGGLRRPERELASVAVSRINGCVFCASVHGRLHAQLTKSPATMERIFAEGVETALDERDRAIVDYAVRLTRAPHDLGAADLAPLRQAGLSDLELLDLTHVVAMFAWANRLLETLGEVVREG
jgi:uncharacterized peroxidase-related enzyme